MSTLQQTVKTSVSSNYQTYIPKKVRDIIGVGANEKLEWVIENDTARVRKQKTVDEVINKYSGIANGVYKKNGGGEKYLEKIRNEWEN